jgi:hypothetical protein
VWVLVSFTVHAYLTDPLQSGQSQNLPRWVREQKEPFHSLGVIGGSSHWIFDGVLEMRKLKQKKRMAREITAAIVQKIEELTHVGVDRVEFEKIDPQHSTETKITTEL